MVPAAVSTGVNAAPGRPPGAPGAPEAGGRALESGDSAAPSAPIRVVIVDDLALFRRGLREQLEAAGIDVVGEAEDAAGAVALSAETEPDVALMDIRMPGGSGIEATKKLLAADPGIRVLMLTVAVEEDVIAEAIMAGACGYLLKNARGDEIVAAIFAAAAGESALSPRVASALFRLVRERKSPSAPPGSGPALTSREREVLSLIVEGRENNEIAAELVISPETVKTHVSSILEKLEAQNRVQAAVAAVRAGLA